MQSAIAELDRRFGVPGIASVVAGPGGLAAVSVTAPEATGRMCLHGGHVIAWQPAGAAEALFVSAASNWEDGRAIRGGVPVCFPWFAGKADDPKAPAHGFVRAKAWKLESIERSDDGVVVSMSTGSDESTQRWWAADFRLVQRVTFAAELRMELSLTNTGAAPLRFEEALHTYFTVGQIRQVRLHGLDGVRYVDKTDGNREKTQRGPIVIESETDRVYLNTTGAVEVEDGVLRRRIRVAKENSRATVVWNPWVDKARAMSDFGDDEWERMVCVETCNVAGCAVELAPGGAHTMTALVSVAAL
jgi:glucose-6-phosphate 1-epimerase